MRLVLGSLREKQGPKQWLSAIGVVLLACACEATTEAPQPSEIDDSAYTGAAVSLTPRLVQLGDRLSVTLAGGRAASVSAAGVTIEASDVRSLHIRTQEIGSVRVDASEPTLSDEGVARFALGGIVEEIEARGDSLEQRWRFGSRPTEEALTIRVAVSGLEYVSTSESGLVFGEGSDAIRYGHGTWIDADGRSTPVPAAYVNNEIILAVSQETLDESSYPAVLDPIIGPAHEVAPITYGHVRARYADPVVGFNGSDYLVLIGLEMIFLDSTLNVDRTRAALDPDPTCVGPPKVLAVGTDWHVWCGLTRYVVEADGTVASKLDLEPTLGYGYSSVVARDGDLFLLAWRSSSDIMGALVDIAGNVVQGPFAIANGPGRQDNFTAISLGGRFYVAYTDDRYTDAPSIDIRGTVVERDGTVADPDGVEIYADPVLNEGGPHFIPGTPAPLLTFSTRPPSGATTVRAVHFDPTTAAPVEPIPVEVGPGGSVMWGYVSGFPVGTGHDLYWLDNPRIRAAHVSGTLTSTSLGGVIPGDYPPSVASDGAGGGLLAYRGSVTRTQQILVGRGLGPSGILAGNIILRGRGSEMYANILATDGEGYLSVFADRRLSGFRRGLYSVGVDFDGQPLGAPVSLGEVTSLIGEPLSAMPLRRGEYLIVYNTDLDNLVSVVVDPMGEVIRVPPPLGDLTQARLARGTDNAMLVASDGARVVFRRLDLDGNAIDAVPVQVTASPSPVSRGNVSFSRDQYLVVWEDTRNDVSNGKDIYATRFGPDGVVLQRDALVVAGAPNDESRPEVVATNDGWLVAWVHSDLGVGWRAVSTSGVAGPTSYTDLGGERLGLDIAFGATDELALLAWRQSLGGTASLRGALIDSLGNLAEPPFAIVPDEPGWASFSVGDVAGVGSQFLVSYRNQHPEARTARVSVRPVYTTSQLGLSCALPSDCGDLTCVDGVCCDSACGLGADDCQVCSVASGGRVDGACVVLPSTTVCRASAGACDARDTCDGVSPMCPHTSEPDGTACRDDDVCNGTEVCQAGSCTAGTTLECDDGNECTTDACNARTGCGYNPIPGCGVPDAGTDADVGPRDAGSDVDLVDAGADAGAPDSGLSDAGIDSGASDGGASDSGSRDGGIDAETSIDAAVMPNPGDESSGCGCATVGVGAHGHGFHFGLFFALLVITRQRRRKAAGN